MRKATEESAADDKGERQNLAMSCKRVRCVMKSIEHQCLDAHMCDSRICFARSVRVCVSRQMCTSM